MTTQHVRLMCDMPHCRESILSAPIDFLDPSQMERAMILDAIARGWHQSAPGVGGWTRLYCPRHAPLRFARPVARAIDAAD